MIEMIILRFRWKALNDQALHWLARFDTLSGRGKTYDTN